MKRKFLAVCFLIFFTLLIFPLGKVGAFEGEILSKQRC